VSESFNKIKAIIEEKGTISPEEQEKITKEHGELEAKETVELESLKLKKAKENRKEVTMEEYLQATKTLESAAEGSDEYKKAEEIVKAFESGA
jgi:type I site-specific restriction endonuclease